MVFVVAAASTVPEIFPAFAPLLVKDRPVGRSELEIDGQVIGPVPAAVNVNEYATPCVAPGIEDLLEIVGGPFIVIVTGSLFVACAVVPFAARVAVTMT